MPSEILIPLEKAAAKPIEMNMVYGCLVNAGDVWNILKEFQKSCVSTTRLTMMAAKR
jgi:hypothetical protein